MVYAWHFTKGNKLRDGSNLPGIGVPLVFSEKPILCEQGLHASLHPFDALQYAPGNTLHLVRCGGTIYHQKDKLVCTKRTIIASFEATEMLRFFARMQALSVIHLAPANMAGVVEDWIMTGDVSLQTATYSATASAAYAARSATASATASAATYSAAYATYSAARQSFAELVYECFEGPMENIGFKGNP